MISLDIGTKYIKMCQLAKNNDTYEIISSAMAPNPVTENPEKKENQIILANRIKSIAKKAFFHQKKTISSIGGGYQSIVSYFRFPLLAPEEIAGAVSLEAEQSISTTLDSLYTDFQVLPQVENDKIDVLFVAIPTQAFDANMRTIARARLDLQIVDIDNLALTNCFLAFGGDLVNESVVLLDIGHTSTKISVIDGGKLRFIRNVNFGGINISNEIASSFGTSFEIAEEIKKQPDKWDELGLNIKTVLRKSMPDLLEAIYRSIEYCVNRNAMLSTDKILLTGGTSYLKDIGTFVQEVLDIPTITWNPIADLEQTGKAKHGLGQFLSVALGLALRNGKNV